MIITVIIQIQILPKKLSLTKIYQPLKLDLLIAYISYLLVPTK